MSGQIKIAIIGAGLAGLRLAQRLSPRAEVHVFEKSRGFGGRMATRRAGAFEFDHGAQYFTARSPAFQQFLEPFLATGTVAPWQPRLTGLTEGAIPVWEAPRFVPVPGMNALAKAMAEGLRVTRARQIVRIVPDGAEWLLVDEEELSVGPYNWVISTAPAAQSAKLVPETVCFSDALKTIRMKGCYSLMIGYDQDQTVEWDVALPSTGPLDWIALNHTKPGRSGAFSVVCHSRNDWADTHMEGDQGAVQKELCHAFELATGMTVAQADYISLHRWRYAKVDTPADQPFLIDDAAHVAVAGDWCGAGRVETAFESASALADAICSAFETDQGSI